VKPKTQPKRKRPEKQPERTQYNQNPRKEREETKIGSQSKAGVLLTGNLETEAPQRKKEAKKGGSIRSLGKRIQTQDDNKERETRANSYNKRTIPGENAKSSKGRPEKNGRSVNHAQKGWEEIREVFLRKTKYLEKKEEGRKRSRTALEGEHLEPRGREK